jgi:ABC-type nitrate/sulfonate/bicarbonate transport system substrate-binding protein/outer membrane protein OmpA-like peptidoglycan-associated protein
MKSLSIVSRLAALALAGLVTVPSLAQQQLRYEDPKPLTQTMSNLRLRPLQADAEKQMFVITWAGDVATKLAAEDNMFGNGMVLTLENDPRKQAEAIINGKTPYFRGTMGMFNAVLPAIQQAGGDMVIIVQLTWSNGGDLMIARESIRTPADLKGQDLALQIWGPHMDFASTILTNSGLTPSDVRFRWFRELTIPKKDEGAIIDPVSAFRSDSSIEAVMVISPDGMILTSGGKVGTGTDDSVKGARIAATSKATNRVIADIIAVRKDYFEANRGKVEEVVRTILRSQEALAELQKATDTRSQQRYKTLLTKAAGMLLDAPQATADIEGMILDAEFVGHAGNVQFFTGQGTNRTCETLTREIQSSFVSLGLIERPVAVAKATWDFNSLARGLKNVTAVKSTVDAAKVAAKVETAIKSDVKGYIEDDTLFEKAVLFVPNQMDFDPAKYQAEFADALNLVDTNQGAIIVVEGHMDNSKFNSLKSSGTAEAELQAMRQAAKNQSLQRANALRTRFLEYAANKGIVVDPNRIVAVGLGVDAPKHQNPGDNAQQKSENRRAVFRIRQMSIEE